MGGGDFCQGFWWKTLVGDEEEGVVDGEVWEMALGAFLLI